MENGIGKISWVNVKSAFVSFIYSAALAIAAYMVSVGSVFAINWHDLINAGAMAGFVAVVSILKSFTTTNDGIAMGIQVK